MTMTVSTSLSKTYDPYCANTESPRSLQIFFLALAPLEFTNDRLDHRSGSLGILPYVYILIKDIAHHPFSSTWMYPVLRVLGSAVAAIMIQLIIQFRLMTIVHRRLSFHAVNHLFKTEDRAPPTWWNPAQRAEDCLSKLRADISKFQENRPPYLRNGDGGLDERFLGVGPFKPYPRTASNTTRSGGTFQPIVICTVVFQLLLLLGMAASVWGYVGCFKIVQSSTNVIGPVVWVVVELVLSLLRLLIWAVNPTTDDPPPPIVIFSGNLNPDEPVAHDIGWKLEDVTVDMHAVVIDITVPTSDVNGTGPRWPMNISQSIWLSQKTRLNTYVDLIPTRSGRPSIPWQRTLLSPEAPQSSSTSLTAATATLIPNG
ncbi:hypothetical protein B0H13DRAFT_172637 [Mycena leptocephala]|nr:hypothetical protein B0H13DRAFT_172637 [Mycena leptocephala]